MALRGWLEVELAAHAHLPLAQQPRAGDQAGWRPALVEQVGDGCHIPDFLAVGEVIGAVLAEALIEEIADRVAAGERLGQLRFGGQQVRGDPQAGHMHERHAAVEDDARRRHILHQVEFDGVRQRVGIAPQPDHHDLADDLRFDQQRRRDVRDRADGDHIERVVIGRGHCACHQIQRRGAALWPAAQVGRRAAVDEASGRDMQPIQQAHDLIVAPLHAVARPGRAIVGEGRGVERLHRELFGRAQGVDDRELVVNFVVRVGVQHHADGAGGRLQALDEQVFGKRGKGHGLILVR